MIQNCRDCRAVYPALCAVHEEGRLKDEADLLANTYYKNEYEWAFALYDRTPEKKWEELTHEKRDSVRRETIRHQNEMQAFGESLRMSKS